jgi:hypothetical protein
MTNAAYQIVQIYVVWHDVVSRLWHRYQKKVYFGQWQYTCNNTLSSQCNLPVQIEPVQESKQYELCEQYLYCVWLFQMSQNWRKARSASPLLCVLYHYILRHCTNIVYVWCQDYFPSLVVIDLFSCGFLKMGRYWTFYNLWVQCRIWKSMFRIFFVHIWNFSRP